MPWIETLTFGLIKAAPKIAPKVAWYMKPAMITAEKIGAGVLAVGAGVFVYKDRDYNKIIEGSERVCKIADEIQDDLQKVKQDFAEAEDDYTKASDAVKHTKKRNAIRLKAIKHQVKSELKSIGVHRFRRPGISEIESVLVGAGIGSGHIKSETKTTSKKSSKTS